MGDQYSDDVIYSQFQTLVGQIKTWSVPFAKAQGTPRLQEEVFEYILRVAPAMKDVTGFIRFLGIPKNMRLFVRGYVGLVIANKIFRNLPHGSVGFEGEDVWMNRNLVQPVSILERALYAGSHLLYCIWKGAKSSVRKIEHQSRRASSTIGGS